MTDLLTLTGSKGVLLHLLAATETLDGLEAEGYIANEPLRAGRVFQHGGKRYRLPRRLEPAVNWTDGITLERR